MSVEDYERFERLARAMWTSDCVDVDARLGDDQARVVAIAVDDRRVVEVRWHVATGFEVVTMLDGTRAIGAARRAQTSSEAFELVMAMRRIEEPMVTSEPRRCYAGIGSRRTAPEVLARMTKIAVRLRELGFWLRSGGAAGADSAFAEGAGDQVEVYLPWKGYRALESEHSLPSPEAMRIAAEIHPAWPILSGAAKRLMACYTHQVLGPDCASPSAFVLVWTPDGAETEGECSRVTGGSGQAIALASRWNIPVVNLAKPGSLLRLSALVRGNKGCEIQPGPRG